jgi:hypothetical protein
MRERRLDQARQPRVARAVVLRAPDAAGGRFWKNGRGARVVAGARASSLGHAGKLSGATAVCWLTWRLTRSMCAISCWWASSHHAGRSASEELHAPCQLGVSVGRVSWVSWACELRQLGASQQGGEPPRVQLAL